MADQNQVPDILNLSDDELMKLDPSSFAGFDQVDEPADTSVDEPVAEDESDNRTADEGLDEEDESTAGNTADDEGDARTDEANDDEADQVDPAQVAKPEVTEGKEAPAAQAEAAPTEAAIDYKEQYERLLAPFKANGRDIAVKSVDDAISLMQMGANYNKKMAALKPNLKLMKLLENNGLLSEEKLSFLIDLEKKNPEAISKLVKDSGIDPLDLDTEKASGYNPQTYTVDDRELALDAVLDEIQDTPSYSQTIDVVSNKWDKASKQIVANQPQLLKVINTHIESGVYDLISKEIESERLFGRLSGISDLEAYRQVGDSIQARGGFAHLGRQQQKTPNEPVVVSPKPKKVEDPKLREKRLAASSTKPAATTSPTPKDFNPLALSDDEFSKTVNTQYL